MECGATIVEEVLYTITDIKAELPSLKDGLATGLFVWCVVYMM